VRGRYGMKTIFWEDMEYICQCGFIPWEKLAGRTVLITGSTGLVGFHVAGALLHASKQRGLGIRMLALARDRGRAEHLYREFLPSGELQFLVGTVEHLPPIGGQADYIVHGAAVTASRQMLEHPAETLWTTVQGTREMLELARAHKAFGLAFLSSMEAYGHQTAETPLSEEAEACLSPANPRDSYPIGKAMAESLCLAYAKEYGVRTCCLRLSQVLGYVERDPGPGGGNIIRQIQEAVREGRDIRLLTKGGSRRTHIYIRDAVSAILAALLDDRARGIYNVADEASYASVHELCEMAANGPGQGRIRVITEGRDLPQYPRENFLNLSSGKIRELGWKPSVSMGEALQRMLDAAAGWNEETR